MSENKFHGVFPAVVFKNLDYVFETSTSFKVMTDLLALPAPYLTGTSDQYAHSGYLPDYMYRTPWSIGNVVSSSKLFLNYSVLDDLRKKNRQTINIPERYNGCMNHLQEENEVIPSSIPDSLNELDISEAQNILTESTDPFQEMFSKMQIDQINLQNEKQDLYLPEEIMEMDHLKQFKRHLPSLKIKLSRLRILPVEDPLSSLIHDNISEDMIHGRCEPYEILPQSFTRDSLSSTINLEEFSKVQLNDEKLVLPNIVETCAFEREDCAGLSKIYDLLMIKPEEMNEQLSVNEIIQRANQNISQVEIYEEQTTEISVEGIADAEPTEQMKTAADMEVDLTLSPLRKDCTNICLSTSTLSKEPLSPQGKISYGSLRDQRELEMALWTAEKHPTFVVSFMLTEPQMYETPVDFHPLPQALGILKSEKQKTFSDESTLETEVLSTRFCSSCDFTESIQSNIPPSKTDVEKFQKISPEQDCSIPSIPTPRSLDPEEPTLDPVSQKSKAQKNEPLIYCHLQKENVNSGPDKASNQNGICLKTKEKGQSQPIKQTVPLRRDSPESVLEDPPCKDLDSLSTFILLRSQQAPPVTVNPQPSADVTRQVFHSEPRTTDQCQRMERLYLKAVVSRNASRDQSEVVTKCMSPLTIHSNESSTQLQRQRSVEVQVQATESQCLAYCEVLSFALPYMNFAHKLGLDQKVWGDFICLTMDQTHFLVKQQEKALSRNNTHNADLIRDQEQLFNQVTLIHVLVTFKELLLKCGLSCGLEFLKKKNMSGEKRFRELLKRLQIILFLSHKKQESNPKLLELKGLLGTWFNNRKDSNMANKILVLITNLDNTRSIVLGCLHQLIGAAAVADLHLEKDKVKLNGASVVSSIFSSECALVCEDHIGPDFPWQHFFGLVEYDHPGPSPWATVCRERGLTHVSFSTVIPGNELSLQRLEDSVPHVLFVTEGLLKCPTLLQTLESMFNITVLERNHTMTLQMLGGTHQYVVITVDERTAVIVQKQEELCQESSSEELVKRLSALSLQYSCCWLILHCPDSRGGGLSSEAFNNLVLVYSSLVIFSMKSEDLVVKVLMVSYVLEIARWISQICFHSLMSSERDPAAYLDRDWLTAIQSNEEKCLLHFPCINPLVSQLMLRRAPSLQWLLTASLSELKEMLPEVPHKVLKLFSDTTSLYTHTSNLSKCESPAVIAKSVPMNYAHTSTWIGSGDHRHLNLSPVPDLGVQDNFCNTVSTEEQVPDMKFELTSSFLEPGIYKQRSWTKASDLRGSSGAIGKMVGRADLRLTQQNLCITTHQMKYNSPFKTGSEFSYNSEVQLSHGLTPPCDEFADWGPGLSSNFTFQSGEGLTRASAPYGSKSFVGKELKRAGDAETLLGTGLTPLKKSRLSYEKVPGRSDGQTRLKLF
ncbi:protein shortage in chiasmata 1 ortholog isoform X2 [Boleophthalmus pectinirostris]|uniref:protein shortage in chiasmata 1 ortholog isoform X2 n=1 Tax=Boleophthalmus pectinirostris TaxID=150288 RepID=UPI00242F1467|nr:protein shortage in chiasmata 1 ortholog isoform X2 [Boleophthalmus pectinirostris]